ncbi:unnamed protein product, partial [Prorocentrum cordatum]
GDPQVQGSDRPAVRGESDAPAGRREAGLRGDCSGHHRGRHQGGGDRWQKSRGARGQVQRSRHQGDPQVHRHQTCDICREVRRGHDQHRRLRVWGPPWGRRRDQFPACRAPPALAREGPSRSGCSCRRR